MPPTPVRHPAQLGWSFKSSVDPEGTCANANARDRSQTSARGDRDDIAGGELHPALAPEPHQQNGDAFTRCLTGIQTLDLGVDDRLLLARLRS